MKILLVDDSNNLRFLFRDALSNVFKNAEFKEAASGQEALDLISEGFCPDLAFVDIGMPTMNGFQLIKKLRVNPEPKISDLRIVVLTDYDILEYREMANTLGCRFLLKTAFAKAIETIQKTIKETV